MTVYTLTKVWTQEYGRPGTPFEVIYTQTIATGC